MSKDYDVHFVLSGYYIIEADSTEEAREIVNQMITDHIGSLEDILCARLRDDNYVVDVVSHEAGEA